MSDLLCCACGSCTTYADAYIADRERTCDETRDGKHDWDEV